MTLHVRVECPAFQEAGGGPNPGFGDLHCAECGAMYLSPPE
jgi:hypothetical protein